MSYDFLINDETSTPYRLELTRGAYGEVRLTATRSPYSYVLAVIQKDGIHSGQKIPKDSGLPVDENGYVRMHTHKTGA